MGSMEWNGWRGLGRGDRMPTGYHIGAGGVTAAGFPIKWFDVPGYSGPSAVIPEKAEALPPVDSAFRRRNGLTPELLDKEALPGWQVGHCQLARIYRIRQTALMGILDGKTLLTAER